LFHTSGLFAFLTPLFHLGSKIIMAHNLEVEESLPVLKEEGYTVILGYRPSFKCG